MTAPESTLTLSIHRCTARPGSSCMQSRVEAFANTRPFYALPGRPQRSTGSPNRSKSERDTVSDVFGWCHRGVLVEVWAASVGRRTGRDRKRGQPGGSSGSSSRSRGRHTASLPARKAADMGYLGVPNSNTSESKFLGITGNPP